MFNYFMKKIQPDSPEYLEALPKATEAYTTWIKSSPEIFEAFELANDLDDFDDEKTAKTNNKTFRTLLNEKILSDRF